jgi:hypothetical protein
MMMMMMMMMMMLLLLRMMMMIMMMMMVVVPTFSSVCWLSGLYPQVRSTAEHLLSHPWLARV